jgi:dihydrofolate reductase
MPKPFSIIAACSENRVIGRDGRLPWRIPEDMAFFKAQTAGKISIMGRVSFQAWPPVAGDGRRCIVITHCVSDAIPGGVRTANSFSAALALAETIPGEVYVCGGQRIFEEAIGHPQAARLMLTVVHAQLEGDRFFPEWRDRDWRETARRDSGDANFRYTFFTFERPAR